MDDKVHIRDVMAGDKKLDVVSTTTMCEQQDPLYKLTFGIPGLVARGKIPNYCERCKNAWNQEADSLKDDQRKKHKVRIKLMNVINLRFGR